MQSTHPYDRMHPSSAIGYDRFAHSGNDASQLRIVQRGGMKESAQPMPNVYEELAHVQ